MSDRELLEAAARAFWAGEIDDVCTVEWGDEDGCILYTHGDNQDHNGVDRTYRWNPLDENYDAFELAVKLGLAVVPYPIYAKPKHSVIAKQYDHARYLRGEGQDGLIEEIEVYGDDPAAATRRAIVRAAAALAGDREAR